MFPPFCTSIFLYNAQRLSIEERERESYHRLNVDVILQMTAVDVILSYIILIQLISNLL